MATAFSSLGIGGDTWSSTSSVDADPYAVSQAEAMMQAVVSTQRSGGPASEEGLRPVFNHPIVNLWNNGLGEEVAKVMDTHKVLFTTIDVVRFKMVEVDEALSDKEEEGEEEVKKEPTVGPVTIWVGVFPESTSPSLAHKSAQDVLALLGRHQITDIDVDFRVSLYTREAGPPLLSPVGDLDPLVDVVSPLTPALGLPISTRTRPNAQGTMALYLNKGDDRNSLLGLTCRHVLISSKKGNLDYVRHPHGPSKDVILLGKRAYTKLADSVQLRIGRHGLAVKRWKSQIEEFVQREKGTDEHDVARARKQRVKIQALVDEAEEAIEALGALLHNIETQWKKPNNRILGPILRSLAIGFGVGSEHFTEDWAVFRINQSKLGSSFQGNKIDLGTKLSAGDFTLKCFPRGDDNWRFEFPNDRLLPLMGTLTNQLMHTPDMWDSDGEPCLLVVKNGNATDTTLGRANGVFSIVRDYFPIDMSIHRNSKEWCILNYDSKSEVFSEPGDSGSIIADIRGRIGGMLTGGAGKTESLDMSYATPFWWLLQRIQANGFPNANLNVSD